MRELPIINAASWCVHIACQPLIIVLGTVSQDEATAALDAKSEAAAYSLVARFCSSYVSVGHRMQLLEWHSHVLVSGGSGVWNKYSVEEYRNRLAAGLED